MLRFIGSALFWAFLFFSSVACFPIAVVIWAVTLPFDRRRVILHQFTSFWGGLYTWCNPAWPVTVVGREKIDPEKTYVMVSNHLSTVDIFVVYRLFTHFKWVSKIENFRLPFIGWNMRLNDYVELRRGDKESIRRMFEACQVKIREGNSIMMFPEGSRSADGKLKPFKPGAFELAIETQSPVLVMTIEGSHHALPKRGFVIPQTSPIRLTVLGSIPVDELGTDIDALTQRVRNWIAEATQQAA